MNYPHCEIPVKSEPLDKNVVSFNTLSHPTNGKNTPKEKDRI